MEPELAEEVLILAKGYQDIKLVEKKHAHVTLST